ncbi:hypothetical protein [Sphingomonas sp. RB1R13]|jgi:hypothetical protein
MIVGLVIALVLAFIAFKFVKGIIKFALIAAIVIAAIYFLGIAR